MPLLFNILSRFVIAFHRRSKRLLISWLQSPSTVILDPKKRKSVIAFTFSPSVCPEVMGLNAMIFIFWMLSFKPNFALSSFTFIKMIFSSSSLPAITVVWSAYLRLLIFLPAILLVVLGLHNSLKPLLASPHGTRAWQASEQLTMHSDWGQMGNVWSLARVDRTQG